MVALMVALALFTYSRGMWVKDRESEQLPMAGQ
jgi:hypothetical protein